MAAITVAGRVAQEYPCHLGQEARKPICHVKILGISGAALVANAMPDSYIALRSHNALS